MKTKLCEENPAAAEMLKPAKNDRSGIGVHYVDAFLKPMKSLTLEDGTKFAAKRRGLKVTLTVGDRKADGLMRRLTVSTDPIVMLRAALDEAAAKLGVKMVVEEGAVFLVRSQ
jgi:hypothetical protein